MLGFKREATDGNFEGANSNVLDFESFIDNGYDLNNIYSI